MASRGSAARRIPGSPLSGIVRDLNRQARKTSRAPGRTGPPGPPGVAGQPGPRGEPGPVVRARAGPWAGVAVTGPDGRATWQFPAGVDVPPVVGAVPIAPGGAAGLVTAVVERVTAACVTVRVWQMSPDPVTGGVSVGLAGAGVTVHLTATPTTTTTS